MQQLLCRHAAIAESRCSNELPSRNRQAERIKKAVISLLSGKSTEPKVAKEHAASCEVDDSQGAKDHRRGCNFTSPSVFLSGFDFPFGLQPSAVDLRFSLHPPSNKIFHLSEKRADYFIIA